MVKNGPKNNKWMRRYRTFFIIGILILSLQIFIVARFLSLNRSKGIKTENRWQPLNLEEIDLEEANSAGKSKLENVDDEDTNSFTRNKKQNQTYFLKFDELDFVPPCHITTKEAVSAINRAKSQNCKQLISNITCLSFADKLYPAELKGSCPSGSFVVGKELGCFKDEKDFRLLNGYYGVNKKGNSPKYCIKLCLQSGFPFAGVQYSNECFCGSDEPPLSAKVPDPSCNLKCPGDQHATCGGYYTINIYQTGVKKFSPQIANTETDSTKIVTKPVRIVFLLTLNGRAARQVRRLLKILYNVNHYYYIHVDVRQDYLFRELLPLENQFPNIKVTRKRFATIWGGASLLEMLRSCMAELLKFQKWDWDFILNLSESDYPVKTVAQLTQFLSANKNKNFVKSHGREVQRFIQKQGLDKTFVECETRMWRVGDRKLPFGIQVDGGSDWIALSKKFVEYVADPQLDDLVLGLLTIFKHTLLPAESFFHTALRNSVFCDTYVDNNLHVTNWKRKLGCKCQYKHVVDWCGCSPNDFRPEDWSRIQSTISRQLYFARKFEPIVNQEIILQLELWLYNLDKAPVAVENLRSYWQNVYHNRDFGLVPDSGLLTIGNSVKRQVLKILFSKNSSCDFTIETLQEINSFHNKDFYKYTLFYFKTNKQNFDVALRPLGRVWKAKTSPLMENLKMFFVSSNYDQKEQISRNFARILTPYSEPVLVYRFSLQSTSKSYDLTCLWISPDGELHDISGFTLDESAAVGHVKPGLKQPVMPGKWTIKLIYKNSQLAETYFLVFPLEFVSGAPIQQIQSLFLHSGIKGVKNLTRNFKKFLPNEEKRLSLEQEMLLNAKKEGDSLSQWIDSLFSEFFSVQKFCTASDKMENICGKKVTPCKETDWSFLAPDPKSVIGPVNETTGTFDIW